MSSKPITLIDWSQWAGMELVPLSVLSDGDPLTPDVFLPGELPRDGAYVYTMTLEPGLSYRFSAVTLSTLGQAYLGLPDSGQVLWSNAAGLSNLGLSHLSESRSVSVDVPTQVTLVIDNPDPLAPLPFEASIRADVPPPVDDENIFRFVKMSTGQYFYTANEAERDVIARDFPDFRFEGAVFSGDATQREGYVPVYRFANLANEGYFYTASEAERASIETTMTDTMRFEGVAFYVPEMAEEGVTVPVIRLVNTQTGGYLFSANAEEVLYAQLQPDAGWVYEGVAFHALAPFTETPEPEPEPTPEPAPEVLAAAAPLDPAATELTLTGAASGLPELFW